MLNANLKQQQVDNKKANSANFQRKSQANPMQYNNRNNIFSENNYYLPKEYYTTIDLSPNATQQTQTNANTTHSNATAPITIGSSGLIDTNTTNTANVLNDQISVLFPKCRPKNDANLNKTLSYIDTSTAPTALVSASQLLASSPSNGDYKNQNQFVDEIDADSEQAHIDNNRSFMRAININTNSNENQSIADERIQAINAGGIDDKPLRMNHTNYRTSNANSNYQRSSMAFPPQAFNHQNDYHAMNNYDAINQSTRATHKTDGKWSDLDLDFLRDIPMWEKRKRSPNTTPANNVLNSPDFNESHSYSHHPVQHQIKVGRSPVNQHDHNKDRNPSPISPVKPTIRTSKGRSAALTVDGDFIFDDVDQWRVPKTEKVTHNKQQIHYTKSKTQAQRFNHILFDDDDVYGDAHDQSNSKNASFNTENVTKMIGKFKCSQLLHFY